MSAALLNGTVNGSLGIHASVIEPGTLEVDLALRYDNGLRDGARPVRGKDRSPPLSIL